MIRCFFLSILIGFFSSSINAQLKTVSYQEDLEDILNPERGFCGGITISPNKPNENTVTKLRQLRELQTPLEGAPFKFKMSLAQFNIILDGFQNSKISDDFIVKLDNTFGMAREAGVKLIIRFSYNFVQTPNNDPPYRDAPLSIILTHIKQLEPVLKKNKDIIAVAQLGFIGVWGEGVYTDYFGKYNFYTLQNIKDRAKVLYEFLKVIPSDRMVQVRSPTGRQQFYAIYKSNALLNRIGFHNDAFLSNVDDMGTFKSFDIDKKDRDLNTPEVLKSYTKSVCSKTVMGGETSAFYDPKYSNCVAQGGQAEDQLVGYSCSFLSSTWYPNVIKNWAKCIEELKKKLGYRFVLKKIEISKSVKQNEVLSLKLILNNNGYAGLFNPRTAYLVLKNQKSNKAYKLQLSTKLRDWKPGAISVVENIVIPMTIPPASYQVYLSLPDSSPPIANRPEYAIRFANIGTWEPNTGLNNLNVFIDIK